MPNIPRLTLRIDSISSSPEAGKSVRAAAVRSLIGTLEESGRWPWPAPISTKGQPTSSTVASTDDLDRFLNKRGRKGVVVGALSQGAEVELYARESTTEIACSVPIDPEPTDSMGPLLSAALRLSETLGDRATLGPDFAIRPLMLPYARPLPPRLGTRWILGDAALFLSRRYHESSPAGDPKAFALLRTAETPDGIAREENGDLTVIRCTSPPSDERLFAAQRYELEVWLSSVLKLPPHPDYSATGDRRVDVLAQQPLEPFTFYDPVTFTAYKALPVLSALEAAPDAVADLKQAIARRQAGGLVEIRRVVVIFPNREAALANREDVISLGAESVVFVGDEEGALWNPFPDGAWIRTDWSAMG